MFTQGSFLQTANETPDQIKRKRALIASMMPQYGKARYIGEGLGQLFQGIGSGMQERKLDKAEADGTAGANDIFSRIMAGGGGGSSFGGAPGGTWTPGAPAPKATDLPPGMGGEKLGFDQPAMPQQGGGGLSFGSVGMTPQEMIIAGAEARGLDPIDVATAMSYETGGTFDPLQKGPTTQWGQHEGLIQFGDPQGAQYGAVFDQGSDVAMRSQLDPKTGAVWKYLEGAGVQPGMGLPEVYSAINAGSVGRMGASDANNGGAPGTVADKVAGMGDHRAKAAQFLGGTWTPSEGGGNITMSAQNAPQQDLAPLYEALANPFMSQEQRAVITQMISQGQQQADPGYQMGLETQRLELDRLRNPQADPMDAIVLEQAQLNLDQDRNGGAEIPQTLTERKALAAEAGLKPGTPEYSSYIATGNLVVPGQGTEYGLQMVLGRDKDGNPVVMQLGKDGTAVATQMPNGVTPDIGLLEQQKAEGSAVGKGAGEAIVSAPAQISNGEIALQGIDEIRNHEGIDRGTGLSSYGNGIRGTKGYAFETRVKQLAGGAFLTAIQQLQGMGALSNSEGQTATAALARLQTGLSRPEFEDALADYEQIVKSGMERAQGKIDGQASPPAPITTPGGNTIRFDADGNMIQ